jgi:hypothetical protein
MNMRALIGIQTHDPSNQVAAGLYLTPHSYQNWLWGFLLDHMRLISEYNGNIEDSIPCFHMEEKEGRIHSDTWQERKDPLSFAKYEKHSIYSESVILLFEVPPLIIFTKSP